MPKSKVTMKVCQFYENHVNTSARHLAFVESKPKSFHLLPFLHDYDQLVCVQLIVCVVFFCQVPIKIITRIQVFLSTIYPS